jgi:protein tyrosine/serine phosphatase
MRALRLLAVFLAATAGLAFAPAIAGIQNFQQVDDRVYRGAQPETYAFPALARLGVKTVLDLREDPLHAAAEEKLVHAAGMRFVSVRMLGLSRPTDDQISRALAVLADDSAVPVFVHCRRGADRTGTVIACYRIATAHWDNQRALAEAQTHGMSPVELGMRRYVLNFKSAVLPLTGTPVAAGH